MQIDFLNGSVFSTGPCGPFVPIGLNGSDNEPPPVVLDDITTTRADLGRSNRRHDRRAFSSRPMPGIALIIAGVP